MMTIRFRGRDIPVVTANTVVVGTGAAGYCAAARLVDFGQPDVVMVTDRIGAGTSRNAGSDKQTYYKLTMAGSAGDSVGEMAQTLFDGGAMDGDIALAEAAGSVRAFLHLVDAGVPFPQNPHGEFVGYKTDHDPRQRATSVGPYTSRTMVEALEQRVRASGVPVWSDCRPVEVLTIPDAATGGLQVAGLLALRTDIGWDAEVPPWVLFRCPNIVFATGGPAGMYANSVYPHGQWGATGVAFRAGVRGKNLTEWQFGLASLHPRWNVSGTYMQAIPRFISTDSRGGDEREFLSEAIDDYGRLLSLIFLKGYQWPFDVQKAGGGSSLIDLLVYRETVLRGRRMFLDFRRNPVRAQFEAEHLDAEVRDYLARACALTGTPVQRLRTMNEPAYRFYLDRSHPVDLATEPLEVAVCVQHNNGGLAVDMWWQSNLAGFFPVGEAAGAHGVYRPGGAALNSGQVGATRAAQFIASRRATLPPSDDVFEAAALANLTRADALIGAATSKAISGNRDNTADILHDLQQLMSTQAGPVRSPAAVKQAARQVEQWLADFPDTVVANPKSRRSIDRVCLARDALSAAYVYLSAIDDYIEHGGRSRGSVLYTDASGQLPQIGSGTMPADTLPEAFRHRLDDGALDDEIQEVAFTAGRPECHWRKRRPIPSSDDFFENVWRDFREFGPVGPEL